MSSDEDLFGSSSDCDCGDNNAEQISQLCVAVVTQTKQYAACGDLPSVICLTGDDTDGAANMLRERLIAHANLVFLTPVTAEQHTISYDACLLVPPLSLDTLSASCICRLLAPTGVFLFLTAASSEVTQFEPERWLPPTILTNVTAVRTVAARVNSSAGSGVDLRNEQRLMEQCVVNRSLSDIERGRFSPQAHKKAVTALRKYGVCVIPSFFPTELVQAGGRAAVADVQEAAERISREHGIELLPGPPPDADFDEYGRLDAQVVRGHEDKFTVRRGGHMEQFAADQCAEEQLRYNPSLLAVLEEVCLAPEVGTNPAALAEAKSMSMLRRSTSLLESQPLGAVVALPGRGHTDDQLLHVDTEHLYEHTHLPPHYLAMFLPALHSSVRELELAEEIGQTAFVAGSHRSSVAKQIASSGVTEAHKARWSIGRQHDLGDNDYGIIRPHCKAGDVVLFDARIMHFGVANHSESVSRPLLFLNYNRPWFSDYQPGSEIIVRHK